MPYKDLEVRRTKAQKYSKKCYLKKREISLKNRREYEEQNRELIEKLKKDHQDKQKEKHRICKKNYYDRNKKKIQKQYAEYNKRKKAIDPSFKLYSTIRCRFRSIIKGKYKSKSSIILLGCSVDEFKKKLESEFTEGMNWSNHSKTGWHIDHILDCRFFNQADPEDQRICFNYRNMRPLWSTENILKGKLPKPKNFQELKEDLVRRINNNL